MTKTCLKKRTLALIAFCSLSLLGIFQLSFSVVAAEQEGTGAEINVTATDPWGYAAFVPTTNHYAYAVYQGTNQAGFRLFNWLEGSVYTESMSYPGLDISEYYPRIEDDLLLDSTTNLPYIDPWNDVRWLEVNAGTSENSTISPFEANAVYNRFTMTEGSSLAVEVEQYLPIEVDIAITSTGPKALKVDFLDDDAVGSFSSSRLVSPSGDLLGSSLVPVTYNAMFGGVTQFYYIPFVAHETGTYRLLLHSTSTLTGFLKLEFVSVGKASISRNTLTTVGNSDNNPNVQEMFDDTWRMDWYSISGSKGDKITLQYGWDYFVAAPTILLWQQMPNGVYVPTDISGVTDKIPICFLESTNVYVTVDPGMNGIMYRLSMLAKTVPITDYTIGEDLSIETTRGEYKAVSFRIRESSFVRFNYSTSGSGLPTPPSSFIYIDSSELNVEPTVDPIDTKTGMYGETYDYYYLLPGEYEFFVVSSDTSYNGIFEISSTIVEEDSTVIPITDMSYGMGWTDISMAGITFEEDPYEYYIRQGLWTTVEITEDGQYFFVANITNSDNSIPTSVAPSHVIAYNYTSDEYVDVTAQALALDGSTFETFQNTNDRLYIAYTDKWHDMEFNLTVAGSGTAESMYVWDGAWSGITRTDTTNNFQDNGSMVLSYADGDYLDWIRGQGTFDLPSLEENDFYWIRINCGTSSPVFDYIRLSNVTIEPALNYVLLQDSEYVYGDYLLDTPIAIYDFDDWLISPTPGYELDTGLSQVLASSFLNAGTYKLLLIPEDCPRMGSVTLRLGLYNTIGATRQSSYTTSIPVPIIHDFNMTTGITDSTHPYNYTTYPFNINPAPFNATLYANSLVIECTGGTEYAWTQLFATVENATFSQVQIWQDLDWQSGAGPAGDYNSIYNGAGVTTFADEFGVFLDHFYLVFFYTPTVPLNDLVEFKIGLSQYDTPIFTTADRTVSTPAPGIPTETIVFIVVGVGIGAGAVIVVAYVYKKRKGV
ncbi:MAG: hypothetical protein JW891_15360 [Candidatus Lokiarchaeota archaeon]|nr:hypothetical protein [Candidatus Lokiarchaeota archaeon]